MYKLKCLKNIDYETFESEINDDSKYVLESFGHFIKSCEFFIKNKKGINNFL